MAELIRISALGRNVGVGDVYNYFNDAIFRSGFQEPKSRLTQEWAVHFFYQQQDKFKTCMLGINSHLQNSIEQNLVDLNQLWFANYLKPNTSKDDDVARVDVFIKVVQQTEFLDQHLINSKINEYKHSFGGLATHLVEEVVYGVEFICSMRRKINRLQKETKESAEENLYRATKVYFDEIVCPNSVTTTPPLKFGDEINCKIFSSLLKAAHVIEGSFQTSISWLREAITNIDKDSLVPIEIVLRHIPEQLETRIRLEELADMKMAIDRNWNWILQESSRISKISTLDRVSPFAKVVDQFHVLLTPLWNKIVATVSSPEQLLENFQTIKDLLKDMTDWLAHRRNETEAFCWLIEDTAQLVALDLEDIKTRTSKNDEKKIAKVFILKVDYIKNSLTERIQKIVGDETSAFNLPILAITKLEGNFHVEIRNKLRDFANEAAFNDWDPNRDTSYYIGLVPTSSSLDEGAIEIFNNFNKSSKPLTPTVVHTTTSVGLNYNFPKQFPENPIWMDNEAPSSDSDSIKEDESYNKPGAQSKMIEFLGKPETNKPLMQQINSEEILSQSNGIATGQDLLVMEVEQIQMNDAAEMTPSSRSAPLSIQENSSAGRISLTDNRSDDEPHSKYYINPFLIFSRQEEEETIQDEKRRIEISGKNDLKNERDYDGDRYRMLHEEFPSDRRTAQKFPTNSSKSLKKAQSNVYLANAKEASVSEDFDSFDICQPEARMDDNALPSKLDDAGDAGSNMTSVSSKITECSYKPQTKPLMKQVNSDGIKLQSNMTAINRNANRRIAEMYATNRQYSELMKKGKPNVYLLNANETSVGEDFRCFDIGQPEGSLSSYDLRNHKVIILMGATGCGKSTLINGMVNYILGVQWDDPFRFKCVRDDEINAKNQAHSQTSSVTAYTLRHHEGMAVPYSITIIDTPGYGDTRGVKRDKEITSKIHQFLTQQEARVEEIHAACFVAASGNSRLTATQGYIIDSVLSIFGKDIKENIRLLVTFADNAHPPVVEACLAANFPVTSPSAGITFSKFNSSVLYASNEKHGDDDFCFDELFWDMGQENFSKFFTMLQGMNGRDLKSTHNVIQSRKLLEQSLKDIEQELEVCLVKIENIEMFRRKLKEYGHKMESNKNFTFEKTEIQLTKLPCENGLFAYNCGRCRDTCERAIKPQNTEKLQNKKRKCYKTLCACPASEHEFQPFEWRMIPVKNTTTFLDMKAEYELNYNEKMSVEQLLANCSYELDIAKVKVLSLLDQVDKNACLLESTALRSSALTPSDYLSLMRSRVAEEQAPGYLTRLETLTELQNCLAANASAKISHVTTHFIPNQTGGASRESFGPFVDRTKTSQLFQHNTTSYRVDSKPSAGNSFSNFVASFMNTASGSSLSKETFQPNQLATMTQSTANNDCPTYQSSLHDYNESSDYQTNKKTRKGFLPFFS